MPPLPQARTPGQHLAVKRREIPFSFWPARPGRRHHALQSLLFALDPWIVIRRAVEEECPKPRLAEALATLEQARDFFDAGTAGPVVAARPLVLYYSYMNLVKAFCLTKGSSVTFDQAQHGLAEQLLGQERELFDAYLDVYPSPNSSGELNNFAEFMTTLTGTSLSAQVRYHVPALVAQILSGHRHWALAANKQERFIAIHEVEFMFDPSSRQLWLRLTLFAEDLSRLSITHQRFLGESRLGTLFREVRYDETAGQKPLVCFEQIQPLPCTQHPLDQLNGLAATMTSLLWVTVSTASPYRRYYAYLCPPAEQTVIAQVPVCVFKLRKGGGGLRG